LVIISNSETIHVTGCTNDFKVGKKILNAEDLGWSGSSGKRPVQKKKNPQEAQKNLGV
jgi:hypothetical protein